MTIKNFTIKELEKIASQENLLEFNREISLSHVNNMAESLLECTMLRLPVLGDITSFDTRKRDLVVIDAQHLLYALFKLTPKERESIGINGSIPCVVKVYKERREVISDVSKINSTQKGWSDQNYLDAWLAFGKENVEHYWNYYRLNNLMLQFPGVRIGFMLDLFAKSKEEFKLGRLEFIDEKFSMKVLQLSHILLTRFKKNAFTLHGLRMWCMEKYRAEESIDFVKLQTRLTHELALKADKNVNGREDFRDFVDETYNRK